MISYEIVVNTVSDERRKWGDEHWETYYELLTEEEAKYVACTLYNMKPDRFEKLARHPSKRFTQMRTRQVNVYKHTHKEPIEYLSYRTQMWERTNKLLVSLGLGPIT